MIVQSALAALVCPLVVWASVPVASALIEGAAQDDSLIVIAEETLLVWCVRRLPPGSLILLLLPAAPCCLRVRGRQVVGRGSRDVRVPAQESNRGTHFEFQCHHRFLEFVSPPGRVVDPFGPCPPPFVDRVDRAAQSLFRHLLFEGQPLDELKPEADVSLVEEHPRVPTILRRVLGHFCAVALQRAQVEEVRHDECGGHDGVAV